MSHDETTAKATKFCKDCVWYGVEVNPRACSIAVDMFGKADPETGLIRVKGSANWVARQQREQRDRCGIEARWFAPKPPSLLARIIARMKA